MIRALKITVAGLVLGTIALFSTLAVGWSNYASSMAGQIFCNVFGWPFVVTRGIPHDPGSDTTFILAIVINYVFYIFLAWLVSRWARRGNRLRPNNSFKPN